MSKKKTRTLFDKTSHKLTLQACRIDMKCPNRTEWFYCKQIIKLPIVPKA